MTTDTLRVIVIGAHPGDCDLKAGGLPVSMPNTVTECYSSQ